MKPLIFIAFPSLTYGKKLLLSTCHHSWQSERFCHAIMRLLMNTLLKNCMTLALMPLALISCQSFSNQSNGDKINRTLFTTTWTLFSFYQERPRAWKKINNGIKSPNVYATFCPKENNFDDAPSIIYMQTQPLSEKIKSPDQVAHYVIQEFRKQGHHNFNGKKTKNLATRALEPVPIWEFSGDNFGNREASAYIMGNKEILSVVLSSKNSSAYRKSLPQFYEFVKSYTVAIKR